MRRFDSVSMQLASAPEAAGAKNFIVWRENSFFSDQWHPDAKQPGLTVQLNLMKVWPMEAEAKGNRKEGTEETSPEQTETRPLSKLRDLRPEKDPIGAGRGGFPSSDRKHA
jgi:hypothetical protein